MKSFLHNSYNKAHKFATDIDRHVSTAKNVYSVLAPMINEFAGGHVNQGAMKALGGYEDFRKRVLDVDQQGREIHGRLRTAAPELKL